MEMQDSLLQLVYTIDGYYNAISIKNPLHHYCLTLMVT